MMTAVVDIVESVRSMGFSVRVGREWMKSEDVRGNVGSVGGVERVSSSTGEFAVANDASDFCGKKNGPSRLWSNDRFLISVVLLFSIIGEV
jgi:hypothetical protein